MNTDVVIVGAGPAGIFTALEMIRKGSKQKIVMLDKGAAIENRSCPKSRTKQCVNCKPYCHITTGFSGAGAFSDGKYNITNQFGGTLYEYVGKQEAIELMQYVDGINLSHGGERTKLYSTANTAIKRKCLENGLHLRLMAVLAVE